MLEYERIDVSEEIDVIKTNLSKECDCYFKDIGFKYEPYLCNGCQKLYVLIILPLYMLKEILIELIFGI